MPLRTDRSAELVTFLNANRAAIVAEQHTIPAGFLTGESLENAPFTTWTLGKGQVDEQLRHQFARNTCNAFQKAAKSVRHH